MLKINIFFVLLTVFTGTSLACTLPKGETIKVGCTYECDLLSRLRLSVTSWSLGYKTKFLKISDVESLKKVDAVLIPGGADIDPKYYLDTVTPELQDYTRRNLDLVNYTPEGKLRDPFEYKVVTYYSQEEQFKELPMLGICRGMQMMSVAEGIPLYLDIKAELGIKNRKKLFDKINILNSSSLMASIYKRENFRGFKSHHQGIRVPYYLEHQADFPRTKVTAYSNDQRIAEAIEYTHRPALGIQYHPESSLPSTSIPVFRWFLTKACEYKKLTTKAKI